MRVRALLLFLALCTFCVQQWAERTHQHGAIAASVSVSAPLGSSGEGSGSTCLLCQIASHAATAGPPAVPLGMVLAARLYSIRLPAGSDVQVAATAAHAWHSRGPPV